ncbi:MAG: cytochrome c biogenesis protein DipZ [Alphaproteobacteria bacterium]|nr:cytochrome c biogenesis protein DipZ [Alphaproteobacteria bacterium]
MNWLDIAQSMLEGLALILSPCILPVLPLVLSATVDGGKSRPFGIMVGFIFAFSAFVLLSRQLVTALHISPDVIRYASMVLLGFMGFVLLSHKLSNWFSTVTQGAANLANQVGTGGGQQGFIGGLGIGALIGFVWTPCAGPILAAVLVQVIRQQTDLQGVLVTVAFALGASIPMLVITLMGRRVMGKLSFFTTHAETVRKLFGVLILLSVGYLAFGEQVVGILLRNAVPVSVEQGKPAEDAGAPISTAQAPTSLQNALDKPYPAPDFKGLDGWLNSDALTMQDLRGKVVLVDFWTYSCINCIRTLPYITAWDRLYRGKGLVIIGVHAPEFEFEKNVDNIKEALTKYGIRYPVALDNNLATWGAYNNRFWPAHYLIDRNGQVVYTHFGEGHYDVTERNIRYLLNVGQSEPTSLVMTEDSPRGENQTPETYFGSARAERFVSTRQLEQGSIMRFKPATDLPVHHWTLGGKWKVEAQNLTSAAPHALLKLHFHAKKVFAVMGNLGNKPVEAQISLNDWPLSSLAGKDVKDDKVTVDSHALYELVNSPSSTDGVVTIDAATPGLQIYTFTFGN